MPHSRRSRQTLRLAQSDGNRSRCRKPVACLSAYWKVTMMIRVGVGPEEGPKWIRLAEIGVT
jgi:hypothetical protein